MPIKPQRLFSIKLLQDERGVIAIVYGLSLLPLVVVIALAVDFGFYVLAQSQLNLAADAAATHAVRVAQQTYLDYSSTVAQAEAAGTTAGRQWFLAQLGTPGIATVIPSVNVTYSTAPGGFTATVSYSGTVPTTVGSFLLASWPISNSAQAKTTNSYLEVIMMLDNSSSMLIGAAYSDIELMMRITPCSAVEAGLNGSSVKEPYLYGSYQCTYNGADYNTVASDLNMGGLSCPLGANSPSLPSTSFVNGAMTVYSSTASNGPVCPATLRSNAYEGDPCAFACHSDNTKTTGSGNDNYALARGTIGTANPITLRFDNLKTATNQLLDTMTTAASVSENLSVGIYSFNSTLTKAYPPSGEAGTDFTAAKTAVGGPPTVAHGKDTGIQPDYTTSLAGDTYFYDTMTALANELTVSGDGSSAQAPRKVLFLITDGYENDNYGMMGIQYDRCTNLKSMGYTIYVIYTPYYPLMFYFYLQNVASDFTSGSVTAALQSCASNSSDYIEVSDLASLNTALQTFLKSAENASAQVSK